MIIGFTGVHFNTLFAAELLSDGNHMDQDIGDYFAILDWIRGLPFFPQEKSHFITSGEVQP